ncbi:MAG TPA: ABC transporter substrate-binding protein, partial [Pyrinomonadaceae bacterium]|nr:ABC transporter substrate-binding protein [Pyrinomonadaceae bacterium]
TGVVTVALSDQLNTLDTLTSTAASGSGAERVRTLIFNTLVRKDAQFNYTGELAKDITFSDDGLAVKMTLRDSVKFHNGKPFTSSDVKYTFDQLFASNSFKAKAFSERVGDQTEQYIKSMDFPDDKSVIFNLNKPSYRHKLLANLVAIPIIPEGSVSEQATKPTGTGPYKFISYDSGQNIVEFEAFDDYWEGAPKIKRLRVKVLRDASSLQAELQNGAVDIAPLPTSLTPDNINQFEKGGQVNVYKFDGSNIQYIGLNTTSPPLDDKRIRQAIAYAIDRNKIIQELLSNQAKIAYSILPPQSWAYSEGTKYEFDPEKAKKLLQEAGYKNQPIKFKYQAGNSAYNLYAQAIQSSLSNIGLNVQIETIDTSTLQQQLEQGQFQMNTGIWIGGNQDPIFLRDLFSTDYIPGKNARCCNRGRYSNPQVDLLLTNAINELDPQKAKEFYIKAWDLISQDVPLIPLWYPSNIVITSKRIGNIQMNASGDWSFIKNATLAQ